MDTLTLGLPKGRIYDDALPLLKRIGIAPLQHPKESRKLIVPTEDPTFNLLTLRNRDVITYVKHGGADLGITGKDMLLEHGGHGLYELLDLRIACCRLVVAQQRQTPIAGNRRLRVSTKFVNCTQRYYAGLGQLVSIIPLSGTMELAPLVDMADKIVDLVDTGATLKANGLYEEAVIEPYISARLIVNRASMKTKHARIRQLIDQLSACVQGED